MGLLRVDTYYYIRYGHADSQIHSGRQKDKIKMIIDGDHWLKLA